MAKAVDCSMTFDFGQIVNYLVLILGRVCAECVCVCLGGAESEGGGGGAVRYVLRWVRELKVQNVSFTDVSPRLNLGSVAIQ